MDDRSYLAENAAELRRLSEFVERVGDDDLVRPMPGGWTVAGVLAHMAFWDARTLALMDRWAGGVEPSDADFEPEEIDWINDAAKPLCLALPPRTAARLALQVAEEADRRVAALPRATLERLFEIGPPFNLSRAEHRREHLDEIEAALV